MYLENVRTVWEMLCIPYGDVLTVNLRRNISARICQFCDVGSKLFLEVKWKYLWFEDIKLFQHKTLVSVFIRKILEFHRYTYIYLFILRHQTKRPQIVSQPKEDELLYLCLDKWKVTEVFIQLVFNKKYSAKYKAEQRFFSSKRTDSGKKKKCNKSKMCTESKFLNCITPVWLFHNFCIRQCRETLAGWRSYTFAYMGD